METLLALMQGCCKRRGRGEEEEGWEVESDVEIDPLVLEKEGAELKLQFFFLWMLVIGLMVSTLDSAVDKAEV